MPGPADILRSIYARVFSSLDEPIVTIPDVFGIKDCSANSILY